MDAHACIVWAYFLGGGHAEAKYGRQHGMLTEFSKLLSKAKSGCKCLVLAMLWLSAGNTCRAEMSRHYIVRKRISGHEGGRIAHFQAAPHIISEFAYIKK
jgi:hypothetical protein